MPPWRHIVATDSHPDRQHDNAVRLFHDRNGNTLVAMFCGQWQDFALAAFIEQLGDTKSLSAENVRIAFEGCVQVVHRRYENATPPELDELFFSSAVDGAVWFSGNEVHCHWLGNVLVLLVRQGQISCMTLPQTIENELRETHSPDELEQLIINGMEHVCVRHFEGGGPPDSDIWRIESGDRIITTSYRTRRQTILSALEQHGNANARELAKAIAAAGVTDSNGWTSTAVVSEYK